MANLEDANSTKEEIKISSISVVQPPPFTVRGLLLGTAPAAIKLISLTSLLTGLLTASPPVTVLGPSMAGTRLFTLKAVGQERA